MQSEIPPDCQTRYRPVRKLSSSDAGDIYLATHRGLGRFVAIRMLGPALSSDRDRVTRLMNEARILAALRHPHIVVVIDNGYEDGTPWVAYEYVPGPSLEDLLRSGPLPVDQALVATAQVASGLSEAHALGVIHRDLYPGHVLQAGPDHFKLTGFGIAQATWVHAGATASGTIVGRPAYMAPERIRAEPGTARSDLYSLGAVLFELLTGQPPFVDGTVASVLQHHLDRPAPAPGSLRQGIPPEVDDLVLKLLSKDPRDRHESASELADELDMFA